MAMGNVPVIDGSRFRMKTLLENMARMGGAGGNTPVQPPIPTGDEYNPYPTEGQGYGEPIAPPPTPSTPPEDPEMEYHRKMLEAYKPQTAANQRFEALLNQYPTRQKPSFGRKLAASLQGFGGRPQDAERTLQAPFNRAKEEWEDKAKYAHQAANLERYENVNQRSLLAQDERAHATDRRLDEYERRGREGDKYRDRKMKLEEFKANNPNMEIRVDQKTGNYIGFNPKTGAIKYPTDSNGNQISGRDLSWADRQNIEQRDVLERIRTAGKFRTEDSPNEIATARKNRANELLQKYPEYADWVEEDTDIPGDIKVADAGTPGFFGKSGPTDEQRDFILNYIYGPGFARTRETTPKVTPKAAPGIKPQSNTAPQVTKPGTPAARLQASKSKPKIPESDWLWDSIKGLGNLQPKGFGAVGGQGTVPTEPQRGTGKPGNPVYPSGPKIKNPEARIRVKSPHDGKIYNIPAEQRAQAVAKGFIVVSEGE